MDVRVDGRGVSYGIADMRDRLGGTNEQPPESVGALTEGLTAPAKEVAAMGNRTPSARQQIALDYLAISRREFETVVRTRIHYVKLAREYGVTNAAIGTALGITESAVRGLTERHAD